MRITDISIPLDIDYRLLSSIPTNFKNERHFLRVVERIIRSLDVCHDLILCWSAEEARIALHILVCASSNVGGPSRIESDHIFMSGKEMIGVPAQKIPERKRFLLAKAEVLQVIVNKMR